MSIHFFPALKTLAVEFLPDMFGKFLFRAFLVFKMHKIVSQQMIDENLQSPSSQAVFLKLLRASLGVKRCIDEKLFACPAFELKAIFIRDTRLCPIIHIEFHKPTFALDCGKRTFFCF